MEEGRGKDTIAIPIGFNSTLVSFQSGGPGNVPSIPQNHSSIGREGGREDLSRVDKEEKEEGKIFRLKGSCTRGV